MIERPSAAIRPSAFSTRIATALLDAGVADPALWSRSWQREKSPSDFVAHAVDAFVEQHGGRAVRRRFFLEIQIGDSDHHQVDVEEGACLITMQPWSSGVVFLKPMMRSLARHHRQLPSTVAHAIGSLHGPFRCYDWSSAEDYREMHREHVFDQTDLGDKKGLDENLAAFDTEHPPVVLPKPLAEMPLGVKSLAQMTQHRNPRIRRIAMACERVASAARSLGKGGFRSENERRMYHFGPQLPVLLIAGERNDRVCASFDEEAQYMMEGGDEAPSFILGLDLKSPASIRQTFSWIGSTVELFAAVSELIDLLPGNRNTVSSRSGRKATVTDFGSISAGGRHWRLRLGQRDRGNLFGDPDNGGNPRDEEYDDEEAA